MPTTFIPGLRPSRYGAFRPGELPSAGLTMFRHRGGVDSGNRYGLLTGRHGIRGMPSFRALSEDHLWAHSVDETMQGRRLVSVAPPGGGPPVYRWKKVPGGWKILPW